MGGQERLGPQLQPLDGLRVLECGDTMASAYAGRVLVDLGADVVVVEDPGGHPMRALAPHLGASPGVDRSAGFACFGAGKRSVVCDAATVDGAAVLDDLVAGAEVVIRSTGDGRDRLTDEALAEARVANPALVTVDISTFGRVGAGRVGAGGRADTRASHPTSDLLALAAGGVLSVNATAPGDPTATPLRYRGELSSIHAATGAVLSTLGALFERDRSGLGQHIDVSAQAAVAAVMATAIPTYTYTGDVAVHDGTRGVAPWGFFACRDATILLQVTEDAQFRAFVQMLGDPEWGSWEIFATNDGRTEAMDVLDPLVADALAGHDADDFLAACHQHGVAAARINTAADLLGWAHLRARGSFRTIGIDDDHHRSAIETPAPPWRYHGTEPLALLRSPRLGSTDAGSVWPMTTAGDEPGRSSPAPDQDATPAPLAGIRVVDLTWVWAGPYAAMQLAHLGAEVVKVESSARLDVTRVLGPWAAGRPGPNRSGYYNQYNLGKQSVLLDLKSQRGRDLLRGLLERADVVIDNMRAGALDRMGFSYRELQALNPRLVAVSMTGFGETGPERDRMAYGSLSRRPVRGGVGQRTAGGRTHRLPDVAARSLRRDPHRHRHGRRPPSGPADRAGRAGRVLDARGLARRLPVARAVSGGGRSSRAGRGQPRRAAGAPRRLPVQWDLRMGGDLGRERPAVRGPGPGHRPTGARPRPSLRIAGRPPSARRRPRRGDHPVER